LSSNLNQMLVFSALLAVAATLGGASLGWWLQRETGPLIVTLAAAAFILTFAWRRPEGA
jgi:ABC-type Mn2+/Zn2+ transport system permease subunit